MPAQIKSLLDFVNANEELLRTVDQCAPVLFREEFRSRLHAAIQEALGLLKPLQQEKFVLYPNEFAEMRRAGLAGAQLELKLESFEHSYVAFKETGSQKALADALDKGATVLGSLAGAIPGFGSFAQELVDFILKELKKRWWPFRKRKGDTD
jgi:hypothetical protein